MKRLAIAVCSCAILAAGCAPAEPAGSALQNGLANFWENDMEAALPYFERATSEDSADAEARVWLAETLRRLQRHDDAIREADLALELEPCNTFAHVVRADASVAQADRANMAEYDAAWDHLQRAVICDSTDGNVWESMWGLTVRRDDPVGMRRSLRKMVETGFLTPAVLYFARWLLEDLPSDAILITNGDMDTYPTMAMQEVMGFRPDVAVVERGLLNVGWGRSFYADHIGVPFPFSHEELESLQPVSKDDGDLSLPEAQILEAWVRLAREGRLSRPVALASTVYRSFFDEHREELQYAGPYLLLRDGRSPAIDTLAIRRSLSRIIPGDFSGPWVSDQDKSPVRRAQTRTIVRNVTYSAIVYAEEKVKDRRLADAEAMLRWAEDFERSTELGPVFTHEIAALRQAVRSAPTQQR